MAWFARKHPLLVTLGALAVTGVAVLAGLVAWTVHRSDVHADADLRRIEATGAPRALETAGNVIDVQRRRGAVLEGDPTAIVVVFTSPGSRAALAREIDRVLADRGFEAIRVTEPDHGGYYDSPADGPRFTVLVEIGDREEPPSEVDPADVPPGHAVARIEMS